MKLNRENINTLWGELVVEELLRQGVDYFVISPGSRSTPLTTAAARHSRARKIIAYDERGAAFYALGYARASGKPAALICTSGTAVANYLPAVVEASVDFVPLLILSADRPPELRETAANQTIRQPHLFGDYLRWQFDLPCPDEKIAPEVLLTTIDQAVYRTRRSPAGPVHLNLMFREPLAPVEQSLPKNYLDSLADWLASEQAYAHYEVSSPTPDSQTAKEIAKLLRQTRKGILVLGRMFPQVDREALRQFAEKLGWPVLADVGSQFRLGSGITNPLSHFDLLLAVPEFRELLQAETILHLGGPLVSKRFLQFLQEFAPRHYLLVKENPSRQDPAHRVTRHIESAVTDFCQQLLPEVQSNISREWKKSLQQYDRRVQQQLDKALAAGGKLSEFAVARQLTREIPAGENLFLASSLPIREVDWYGDASGTAITVGANRGASGIDGTIASAAGFAAGNGQPTTLLIGDLAFLHDLNSLALLHQLEQKLIIVLLNNQGGGIFSFLPIAKFPEVFDPYFITPHEFTFARAADLFGLDYAQPRTLAEFLSAYQQAQQSPRPTLIEVLTEREENRDFQKMLLDKIAGD